MNPGKKSKSRDRHRARFAEKKSRAQRCVICICFCALDFFPESVLGDGPKNSRIRVNCLKSTVHCVKHANKAIKVFIGEKVIDLPLVVCFM